MQRRTVLKTSAWIAGILLLVLGLMATQIIPSPLGPRRHGPPQNDMVIDQAMRVEILERLVAGLNQSYVFPEKAKEMETLLRARQTAGKYDGINSAETFASALTEDLQGLSKDLHLEVGYSEGVLPQNLEEEEDALPADRLAELQRVNFGVHAVDRLKGNIGYIDLHAFAPPDLVAGRFAAAMTLLENTQALIIDLRFNGGGSPESVALLASFLFDERTHLNDIYSREGNHTRESWTQEQVAGPRYGSQRKVYLLTSTDTFSAGEDFAYALKNLKRATLIGAATGGGAHPGGPQRLTDHFAVHMPMARSISPITHTDWEGVGVIPDIEMDPEDALDHAQVLILTESIKTEKNEILKELYVSRVAELD
jgi:hypothetical protein